MNKAKTFQTIMIIVLVTIGILQFFDIPKVIDCILGIVALGFGLIGYLFVKKS